MPHAEAEDRQAHPTGPNSGPATPEGLPDRPVARRAPDDARLPRARQALPQVLQPQAAAPDHHAIAMPAEVAAPRVVPCIGGDTMLTALFTMAMSFMAWQQSEEKPGEAVGFALAAAGAAALMLYTCLAPRRPEAPGWALMRRFHLRGQPLGDVIKSFCDRNTPAAQFDWSAPGVFVDDLHHDQAAEVSHVLARAFRLAGRNPALLPALRTYANQLASQPDLRKALAVTVRDANASCDDRLGVSIGRLMLSGVMHQLRDPATPPPDVVHALVLHAATQAIHSRIFGLMAEQDNPTAPSAELLLLGSHAVQSGLREAGLAVPAVFPENLYLANDVRRHQHRVKAAASQIAQTFAGPGGGASLVGLLQAHGGKDVDEILSARLDHHLAPVRERLLQDQPQGPDADGLAAANQQLQAYQAACNDLFVRAVDDALWGNGGLWTAPAAAGPAPDAGSIPSSPASPRHSLASLTASGLSTADRPVHRPEALRGTPPGSPSTR